VATQDVAPQPVPQTEHAVFEPAIAVPESHAPIVESTPITPNPAVDVIVPEQEKAAETIVHPTPTEPTEIPSFAQELESGRRSELPSLAAAEEPTGTPDVQQITPSGPASVVQGASASESVPTEPQSAVPTIPEVFSNDEARSTATEPVDTTEIPIQTFEEVQEIGAAETQAPEIQSPTAPTRQKRRKLPWTAVNVPRGDDEDAAPAAKSSQAKSTRRRKPMTLREIDEGGEREAEEEEGTAPQEDDAASTATASQAKPKRRRKPMTLREMDEEEELEAEEEELPARPKRASTRARGKRTAPGLADGVEAEDAAPPAKKARKPRKDKGKKRAPANGAENENGEAAEGEDTLPKKRRKKQNTAQALGVNDGEEGAEGEKQSKRRGRPQREPTPSDAEDNVIDPGATLMNSIASRNIRVGKLSEREKQMRTINWDEVKQARREKEKNQTAREIQAEMDRLRKEQEEAEREAEARRGRVEYVNVDGQFVVKAGTGVIDQEAEAQRAHEEMVVVAEDDITKQINARSFLRNNKRFPNEFLLPGQGKQWSFQDTEDFYSAMSIFGTDFGMMESLFPGVGRKSIKKKFNREEKCNPQRVKEILQGQRNSNWGDFLQQTGRTDEDFADVDAIKAQLEAEAAEMQKVIDEAKEAAEERKRQRRIAGVESEDEAAGDKENEKAKKGKRKAAKKVGFELAADEEVVGAVGEDDNWGVE